MHDSLSIELLKTALIPSGYTTKDLILDGQAHTQFISHGKDVWLTSNNQISYPFMTSTAKHISKNKNMAYQLARQMGVTIPMTKLLNPGRPSKPELKTLLKYAPLIVKPNSASSSRGLTVGITNISMLLRAIALARTFGEVILVQQQVEGEEIRFTLVDGKVRAAMLRQTPRLIGDGKSSIGTLIERENAARQQLSLPYIAYPQLEPPLIDLTAQGMDYVPQRDEVVELSRSTLIREGASVYNILEDVHESYIFMAQRLAGMLGRGFLVVDIIIDDYRQPRKADNYAFIEFNTAPALKLFYSCRDEKHYDILHELKPLIDKAVSRG